MRMRKIERDRARLARVNAAVQSPVAPAKEGVVCATWLCSESETTASTSDGAKSCISSRGHERHRKIKETNGRILDQTGAKISSVSSSNRFAVSSSDNFTCRSTTPLERAEGKHYKFKSYLFALISFFPEQRSPLQVNDESASKPSELHFLARIDIILSGCSPGPLFTYVNLQPLTVSLVNQVTYGAPY